MPQPCHINFTVAVISNLPAPNKGIAVYKDKRLEALSLYVTSKGAKTFFVRKRIKGRDERLTIGRFPSVTIEQARKQATVFCGIIAERKDPLEEAKRERHCRLTFGEHFHDYMERYSKLHKRTWKADLEEINRHASHWFNRKLSDIKRDDVARLHEKLGTHNGKHVANSVVRKLSSIFNKAILWGWQGTNPIVGVKHFKTFSRDRFIQPSEMPYLLNALAKEGNETARDYLMMLLITGVRKTNALTMQWSQISWDRCEWRIPETKNGDVLTVPLIDQAMQILERRKGHVNSIYVFPQEQNPQKPLCDPGKAWRRVLAEATLARWNEDEYVAEWLIKQEKKMVWYLSPENRVKRLLGFAKAKAFLLPPDMTDIRIHDIRRTFGSYQALTGASLPIIGKSLGHKSSDTTQIYARLNLDPVRAAVEKATAAMFAIG